MGRISRHTIEAIREKVNLVDVVAPYCQLRKVGTQYRGLSPFNDERTPSFYIHPEKNVFKCYSSGHAGDLFRFVQLKENLPFQEAIEALAQRFGIPIEYEKSALAPESTSLKKELFRVHEIAALFYQKAFWAETADGKAVREYWQSSRNFALEIAKTIGIGLAPGVDKALLAELFENKISSEAIRQCGLFYIKEGQTDLHYLRPRFRGRLMIPIRDVQGRIVAFTGRVLPLTPKDDPTLDAKYVNSPETPLFSKSHLVFGLDYARTHIKEQHTPFLLVEGQIDTIRCWEKGLQTAVAPQGTSVTPSQLTLLRRYSQRVDIVMDGDAAGTRAALRLLPMAIEAGLEVHFISLPEGADPDSFLQEKGLEGWQKLLDQKKDAIEFALQSLAPEGRQASPHVKDAALRQLFSFYENSHSFALAEGALKRAGNLLGISEYAIDLELPKIRAKTQPTATTNSLRDKSLTTHADVLLIAASLDPRLNQALSSAIPSEWLEGNDLSSRLLDRFLAAGREGLWKDRGSADELLETDEERNHFYSLLSREDLHVEDIYQATQEAFASFFEKTIQKKKEAITRSLATIDPNDHLTLSQLQKERINIRRLLEHPPQLSV